MGNTWTISRQSTIRCIATKPIASNRYIGLQQNEFVSGQTRMLSIDFSLFNPTISLHTVARIIFEFPHSGDVEESFTISTWKFLRSDDYFMIVLQVLYVIGVIMWTVYEIHDVYHNKVVVKQPYCNVWNVMDWSAVTLYWINISVQIVRYVDESNTNFLSVDKFESLQYSQFLVEMENYLLILNGALLFIRIFKYFRFSQRLRFLAQMFHDTTIRGYVYAE
eukprot:1141706_1